MEKSPSAWKTETENHRSDFRCGECGEEFHQPLLAKISSSGSVRTYYACPRCLTKVAEDRRQQSGRAEETPISLRDLKKASMKSEEGVSCQHFFGYLGKRPKDTSIPEDCLVCERMIECMVH
jgi:DNA-directed RNA polymerase subunit RPC12/RpoP